MNVNKKIYKEESVMYKVVGVREEKYIGKEVSGHNCDFEYTDVEMIRHVILLVEENTLQKVELTLSQEQGECGSGWCVAFFGDYVWAEVETFAGKTHTCKESISINVSEDLLESNYEDDFSTEVFTFSSIGGCSYYPSGGYNINMDLFEEV
jgi:hypothetical protein